MDPPTFYRIGGHLNLLVDSVEIRIKLIPSINHTLYLRDIPILRRIVSPVSMEIPWDSMKGPLSTGALTALEFCANELGKIHAQEDVSQEELIRFKMQFGQLLQEVSNSTTLSSEMKIVLLDLLTSAILAIDQYRILGIEGLKKAIAYAVGTVTLHKKLFLTSKTESVVGKVMETVRTMGTVVGAAYKVKELTGDIPDFANLLGN